MTEYIQPEIMLLIPVLYLVGYALKKLSFISDRFIPVILGGVGVMLAALYFAVNGNGNAFMAVTQGILCAGASTYANQIYKQLIVNGK